MDSCQTTYTLSYLIVKSRLFFYMALNYGVSIARKLLKEYITMRVNATCVLD